MPSIEENIVNTQSVIEDIKELLKIYHRECGEEFGFSDEDLDVCLGECDNIKKSLIKIYEIVD